MEEQKKAGKDIRSYGYEGILKLAEEMGEKPFRGRQLYEWIHQKKASSFNEMTNLPKAFRQKLDLHYSIQPLHLLDVRQSSDGDTTKYLFELADGCVIESVFMKYQHGRSACISSQVGCRMGCRFCASTLGGLERNLTVSELLSQIYEMEKLAGERVSHVVVMGTGEPLDNYANLIQFLRMLSDGHGLHISQRNLTISTCGLVPKIYELAEEKLAITLAISLHAPNDAVRRELMPIANRYTMDEIRKACLYYFETTGRRITFEYSLVRGVNDREEHARELAEWLSGWNSHVNLIPVNPIKERNYRHSEAGRIRKFKFILEKNRINVTIRREMGSDIDAACGQLRMSYMEGRDS